MSGITIRLATRRPAFIRSRTIEALWIARYDTRRVPHFARVCSRVLRKAGLKQDTVLGRAAVDHARGVVPLVC